MPTPAALRTAYLGVLARHATLSSKRSHTKNWKDSGEAAAEKVYAQTIGLFVKNCQRPVPHKRQMLDRLNNPVVARYVASAIGAIGRKAQQLAGAGEVVDGWHLRSAARKVIKRYRTVCPSEIKKGTFERETGAQWQHGELCRDFEV